MRDHSCEPDSDTTCSTRGSESMTAFSAGAVLPSTNVLVNTRTPVPTNPVESPTSRGTSTPSRLPRNVTRYGRAPSHSVVITAAGSLPPVNCETSAVICGMFCPPSLFWNWKVYFFPPRRTNFT